MSVPIYYVSSSSYAKNTIPNVGKKVLKLIQIVFLAIINLVTVTEFFNCHRIFYRGAALTAYGKLQYTNMSEKERLAIKYSLLKYCELDTLAMVMIYERFKELIG